MQEFIGKGEETFANSLLVIDLRVVEILTVIFKRKVKMYYNEGGVENHNRHLIG